MDAAALSGRRAARAIYKAEKHNKPAITFYEKSMRKIVNQNRKNTENSLLNLKTNEELLDHMKRSSLKSGLKTMFFNKLNKILPANRIILLPK